MIECSMTGLILLYRVVPESPRWLISNGRIKEAKAIITEVGRENQRQVPLHLFSNNNTSQAEDGTSQLGSSVIMGELEEIGEAVEEIRKEMLTRAEMENFRPTGRRE